MIYEVFHFITLSILLIIFTSCQLRRVTHMGNVYVTYPVRKNNEITSLWEWKRSRNVSCRISLSVIINLFIVHILFNSILLKIMYSNMTATQMNILTIFKATINIAWRVLYPGFYYKHIALYFYNRYSSPHFYVFLTNKYNGNTRNFMKF
jgi:hypothetical protein